MAKNDISNSKRRSRRAIAPIAPIAEAPTNEAIAQRAFELFVARGGEHGRALEDWVQAEQELRVAV
jgi:hypothetical protein